MTVKTNWIGGAYCAKIVKDVPVVRKKTTNRKSVAVSNYITKPAMARYLDLVAKAIRFGDPRSLETKADELRKVVDSYLV